MAQPQGEAADIGASLPVMVGHIGAEHGIPTVDGRKVWEWLCLGDRYADWVKTQIARLHCVENRDFIVFRVDPKNLSGGRPSIEYHFTLDMAKHIVMLSDTQRGYEARDYFI